MAKFNYSAPHIDIDRAYVLVDDRFDIHLIRTEEGLIIDVYRNESNDLLDTLCLENPADEEE